MDKLNYDCLICNRNLPISEKSNHENSKKHMLRQKRSTNETPNTTIFVRENGKPLEKKVYREFFEQFGRLKNIYIIHNTKTVAVTFVNLNNAQSVLQARNNLYLKGSKLSITGKQVGQITKTSHQPISTRGIKNKGPRPCLPPTPNLPPITSFDLRGDFEQQLMTLMYELRLKPHVIENLQVLGEDIRKVLNQRFPGCRVLPFGSVVNGLAIVDSDVDCYIELLDQNYFDCGNSSRNLVYPIGRDPGTIKIAKSVFMSHPQIFSHVFMIPTANVPIIKCRHVPTGFNVDINFKSSFGVANSSLIRFFLSTDARLIPLFVLIKYWIKIHGIKLLNYAVILMVIFYLQRLPKPILPPVNFLQSNPTFDIIKDGWNCGFDDSLDRFPQNHNTSDVLTLLEGFFHFYTNVILYNVVISPLCGLTIPAEFFKDPSRLSSEFHRYVSLLNDGAIKPFSISQTLNVQDPFELNRNVTISVSFKVKERFVRVCSEALLKIEAARNSRRFDNLLYNLMSVEDVRPNLIELTNVLSVKKNYPIIISGKFSEKFISLYCNNVKLLMDNILRNILKCKFLITLPLVNPSSQNQSPRIQYSCEPFYNLWSTRNDYNSKVSGDRTSMNWYITVSEYILDSLFKNQQPTCPLFKFLLDITFKLQQKCVIVDILNVDAPQDVFLEFGNFLTSVIDMGMSVVFEN